METIPSLAVFYLEYINNNIASPIIREPIKLIFQPNILLPPFAQIEGQSSFTGNIVEIDNASTFDYVTSTGGTGNASITIEEQGNLSEINIRYDYSEINSGIPYSEEGSLKFDTEDLGNIANVDLIYNYSEIDSGIPYSEEAVADINIQASASGANVNFDYTYSSSDGGFLQNSLTFPVEIDGTNPPTNPDEDDNDGEDSLLNTTFNRFRSKLVSGTYLFANNIESIDIINNFSDAFQLEGEAFKVSSQDGDNLIQFNRFRNKVVEGTYLFVNETESISIIENFSDVFELEGTAFYAYGATADIGIDYYRLRNTQIDGTYLFVSKQERDSALAQFPELFVDEGIAFEVGS